MKAHLACGLLVVCSLPAVVFGKATSGGAEVIASHFGAEHKASLFDTTATFFIENIGQFSDNSVRFVYHGKGGDVRIKDDGLAFCLKLWGNHEPTTNACESVFEIRYKNAQSVRPTGLVPSKTRFNFQLNADPRKWQNNVPAYEKVTYAELYPGINLVVFAERSSVKCEFRVAPGADYRQIEAVYGGVSNLFIAEDGSLHAQSADGVSKLVEDAPYVYQDVDGRRVEVSGRFELLSSGSCAFRIDGPYDPTCELIIDPEMTWSTYLGGANDDRGYSVTVDDTGNIYVAGATDSADWASEGFDISYDGNCDAFVAKFSAAGQHLWSTYLGGSDDDCAYGIAVANETGHVYVTGATRSGGWVSGGQYTNHSGGYDSFIVKLSSDGAHLWSTYLGGTNDDYGRSIAVDGTASVCVSGFTWSGGWVSSGFDTTHNGGDDGFVAKFNSNGEHVWSTYLGGDGNDFGYGVSITSAGDIYVTGGTDSSGWISGGFDTTFHGISDGFVVKLSSMGDHLWSTYLGGSDDDWGYGVVVDGTSGVYLTGSTRSAGWISGGFDASYSGGYDAFVVRLDSNGDHLCSTYLGGSNPEDGAGIARDDGGNVYVTGTTLSDTWVSGGFDTTINGGGDVFVAKLSSDCQHLWSTYFGGSAEDFGAGIAVDVARNVCVTGYTFSEDWVAGGLHTSYFCGGDIFVARIERKAELIVHSTPMTGISISGIPAGTTDYMTTLDDDSVVSLIAPVTSVMDSDDYTFFRWMVNGSAWSENCTLSFVMNGNTTVVAEYSRIRILDVKSTSVTSVPISGNLGGTTDYTAEVRDSAEVTLIAPLTHAENDIDYAFLRWSVNGVPQSDGATTLEFTISVDSTAFAEYAVVKRTLNVQSMPVSGVVITGTYSGTTTYETQSDDNSAVTLAAPGMFTDGAAYYSFLKWALNGTEQTTGQVEISFNIKNDGTVVAEYRMLNPEIYVDPLETWVWRQGDLFDAEIRMNDLPQFKGTEFVVSFDTSVLEVISAEQGAFVSQYTSIKWPSALTMNATGSGTFTLGLLSGTPSEGAGIVVKFKFSVKGNASDLPTAITITDSVISDMLWNAVAHTTENGAVKARRKGDFDLDGDVDFWDFVDFIDVYNLTQSDPAWEPDGPVGDFDDSGVVDFWDFTLFIDVYGS